jgi:hypothetical protein
MKTCKRLMVLSSLLSVLTMLSLSAMAEDPKKPTVKPAPAAPAGHQIGPGRPAPQLSHSGPATSGGQADPRQGPIGHSGSGIASHRRVDSHHFDRAAWGRGRAYPHECRWGRCGYWWWLDGYWYFYDQAFAGPPEAVSEIAYDDQGNLAPVETVEAPPPPPPPPPDYGPPAYPVPVGPPAIVVTRPPVCVGPVCF